jgi:NTP pyrophosphatase (non-canonical NTP hydrolase)
MNTYRQILEHWGLDKQINQVSEECAELVIALNKWRRSPDDKKPDLRTIAEEIADVQIMLEQMKEAFQCDFLVETLIEQKLERTLKRMSQ